MEGRPRYLAFDVETAAIIPGTSFDWRSHRPLGITCAATLASDEPAARLWHGKSAEGGPSPRMRRDEARGLVEFLAERVQAGYQIVTWNGLAFDFDILAEESGEAELCKRLAWDHLDMMFHVFCSQGYRVALDKAAQGMGLPGKPPGMKGYMAPQLWAEGCYEKVLHYVGQDVATAMELAQACATCHQFRWMTAKGTVRSLNLREGWLPAKRAFCLPEPDTSWMDRPASRGEFIAWLR